MNLIKFGFILLWFSASSFVNASMHEAKIVKIRTYLNGGIYVFIDSQHECGSNQVGMDASAAGFQMVYSALLAYEAQRKSVRFAIQSCNGTLGMIDRIESVN